MLCALIVVAISLDVLNPLILRGVIDGAAAHAPLETLMHGGVAFIAVAIIVQVLAVVESYVAESVSWTATNRLRVDLALHCLTLDQSFHHARTPGELIERVDGDVTQLANFFSRFTVKLLGSALLLLGVLVMLWTIHPLVGLTLTIFTLAGFGVLLRLRAAAEARWGAVRAQSAAFFGVVGEHLAGLEDVKALGAGPYVLARVSTLFRAWLLVQRSAGFVGGALPAVTVGLNSLGTAIAFVLGALLFERGALSLGTVYLIFQYTELLRGPSEELRRQLQDLQLAGASISRIEALFGVRKTVLDGEGVPPAPGPLALAFEHVTFAYDGAAPVLRDVSFALSPGKVLGVLGSSGSGKTTLTRLLLRFYDPGVGVVLLGGRDATTLRVADLRRRVAMVTQDVQIFNATVRENLTLFDDAVADDRTLRVIDDLGLGPWFAALPTGLDTVIGAGGVSAGESQLLAFARVFLRDPDVLLLDEASARLDPATERLITRATNALLDGRTAIIIAHRLTTVREADDILILERGRVVEYGPRAALAADPASRFARLSALDNPAVTL